MKEYIAKRAGAAKEFTRSGLGAQSRFVNYFLIFAADPTVCHVMRA